MNQRASPTNETETRSLVHILAGYRTPDGARAIREILVTAVPFILLWLLMWASVDAGIWLGLVLAIPAAGFLVRLFMIQHDCGHGSFFRSSRARGVPSAFSP